MNETDKKETEYYQKKCVICGGVSAGRVKEDGISQELSFLVNSDQVQVVTEPPKLSCTCLY